jgi:hypothetical protein
MGDNTRHRCPRGLLAIALALVLCALAIPSATAQAPECPDGGQITITRELGFGTVGQGESADFTYTVTGPEGSGFVAQESMTVADGGSESIVVATPAGLVGTFSVAEDTTHPAIPPSESVSVTIDPATGCAGQVVFVNHVDDHAKVRVVKTETSRWGTRRAQGKWTFTLTGGPGDVTLIESTNREGNNHRVVFRDLRPGSYTLCERYTGWISNLGNGTGYYQPNGDRCTDVELEPLEAVTFRVNNRCPLSVR